MFTLQCPFYHIVTNFSIGSVFGVQVSANTLPLAQLNFQSQFSTNYNLAFASYLLALIPILIFYLICQKQIINGVVNGAIK